MIYLVTASSFDRKTKFKTGGPRVERVTTDDPLFADCRNADDIKATYEEFWNDVNPDTQDIVKVLKVVAQ